MSWGQNGLKNPVLRDFPPVRVRPAKTWNAKELRTFGDRISGRPEVFPQKCPYHREIVLFRFLAQAWDSSKCQGPVWAKMAQKKPFRDFRPVGVGSANT